jgi:hypothetical protein
LIKLSWIAGGVAWQVEESLDMGIR